MPGLKERAKTLVELIDGARFLFADRPLALDDKAAAPADARCARRCSATLAPDLAAIEPMDAPSDRAAVRAFAERKGVKLGAVAQPLRAALTGRTTSPAIFDVLVGARQARKPGPPLRDQAAMPPPEPAHAACNRALHAVAILATACASCSAH